MWPHCRNYSEHKQLTKIWQNLVHKEHVQLRSGVQKSRVI